MFKFTAKNKLIVIVLVWLGISAAMFGYFFTLLDASNQLIVNNISSQKDSLQTLQSVRENQAQAQADLDKLAQQSLQPDDFFSRDINLVKEIETLEALSKKYNVKMQLSGVSGIASSLPSAGTVTPIGKVPYSISLNGDFVSVVNFIENLEHLSFVTNITSLSLNTGDNGTITAGLASNFYVRK